MQSSQSDKQTMLLEPEPLFLNQNDDSELGFLDILAVLVKRKRLLAKITLAGFVAAVVISLLLPNRYTATAVIMPPQQSQPTASMLLSQLASTGIGSLVSLAGNDLGLKNPNDLYIGMLKSRTVQDDLISQFNLQEVYRDKRPSDVRNDLTSYSNIVSGKDGLISISVEDKDPHRAAAIANSYVDELRKLMQRLAVTEASQRRAFFEQQWQRAKEDLANAEVEMKNTQQKTGLIELNSQARAMIEAVGQIRAQIAAQEVQLQAMGSFATEQNPEYVVARQELAGLRTQLSKLENQQSSGNGDPLVATGKIPAVGLEYVRRLREVKYREAIFELLAKQFEAAKLDEAQEAAVIQVMDPAVLPDKKSWPHRSVIVAVVTLCALLLGAIYVLLAESVRGNHRISEQLSQLRISFRSKEA